MEPNRYRIIHIPHRGYAIERYWKWLLWSGWTREDEGSLHLGTAKALWFATQDEAELYLRNREESWQTPRVVRYINFD